ncbi:hypothetical protein BGW94_2136 [Fibrobacter sp. NR9]|nr:hypothetical protein BGW94_2136 [Fibrobacter sp. NR9]
MCPSFILILSLIQEKKLFTATGQSLKFIIRIILKLLMLRMTPRTMELPDMNRLRPTRS